jgi:hypothetical protein
MPGKISVTFQREPSYFAGAVVDGRFHQVIVCRDSLNKRVVGFGCRGVRPRYVNGHSRPVGYLSLLRLLSEYRSRGLVARGYKFLRQLHGDGCTPLYLTTIAQGNERAISTLTSARAFLPGYHRAGDYQTAVIPIPRRSRGQADDRGFQVRNATPADVDILLPFLARVGPSRQFFPKYEQTDFFQPGGTFRDLRPDDLLLAFSRERLVGVLGAWDQHRFRQTVVHRLDAPSRWWRPVYNALANVRGWPRLPKPGGRFCHVTAVLPVVEHDDRSVFTALLDTLLDRLTATGHDFLLLGMHETDPLLELITNRAAVTYVTHVYHVCWTDGEALLGCLDDRPIYLELGCL